MVQYLQVRYLKWHEMAMKWKSSIARLDYIIYISEAVAPKLVPALWMSAGTHTTGTGFGFRCVHVPIFGARVSLQMPKAAQS